MGTSTKKRERPEVYSVYILYTISLLCIMASMFKAPENFAPPPDSNVAQAWSDWKQQFEYFILAAEKKDANGETKIAMLLCSMGPQWIKVFNSFTFEPVADKKNFEKVKEKFDKYFEPKKLLKGYITRFQNRKQSANESLSEYIAAVRELASNCEFGNQLQTQVCVQISNGVRDAKLREKLWEDDLTLDDVIKRCNFYDQMEANRKVAGTEEKTVHYAARGRSRGRQGSRGRSRGRSSSGRGWNQSRSSSAGRGWNQSQEQSRGQYHQRGFRGRNFRGRVSWSQCRNCGYQHDPQYCPAKSKICYKCSKTGHFARWCRSEQSRRMNFYEED